MDPGIIAVFIPIVALFIPISAIWTGHLRKMAEMKLQIGAQGDQNVLAEMQRLRQEMSDLRDTTTRYDLSFDAALQRIESRVGNLEGRVSAVEQAKVGAME